jgi:predicted nucleic acid-binding protein
LTHVDTTFLVDLLRERGREEEGPATAWLATHPDEELWTSVHVACELFLGAELAREPMRERANVERVLAGLQVAYPDEAFPRTYGRVLATVLREGQRIGTMDLLIATAALTAGGRILTRNEREFGRVPGLEVVSY